MSGKVYETTYKDVRAVALESGSLRAIFLPEWGGKMASLIHLVTGREFLVQADHPNYKKLAYGGDYVAAECSGFDDMFPTIDRVRYPEYPWEGIEMPDHGEVCALKWDHEIADHFLWMAVHGVRFPYRLEKRIGFDGDNTLVIEYKASNLCGYDLDCLWAAHPMIRAEEGGEIMTPFTDTQEAILMFAEGAWPGRYGDALCWPIHNLSSGSCRDLRYTSLWHGADAYKFYFRNPLPEGWCAYRYPSDGMVLRLDFPCEKVPYLGVWVNEAGFKGYFNIALEMCTGAFDRPDIARKHKMHSVLRAHSTLEWFLMIGVNKTA